MYTIHDYGDMIADHGRTRAYAQALQAVVTPASVVLDIGSGAGILTLLACRAGARRVYAVEPDGVIEVAREMVRANGYADRVTFMQAASDAVDLPETVDVIVSDVHGVLPLFCGSPTSIIDARDRFLAAGGVLIPARDTISAAVVSAPEAYRSMVGPWEETLGFDGAPGRLRAVNAWRRATFPASALLVEPRVWVVLDYPALQGPNASGDLTWTIERAGEAHGLCLWFDCDAAPGCRFSNSPLSGEAHVFGQGFFQWPRPCTLEPGDQVHVTIRADLVGEDYVWSWDTDVRVADGRGPARARFRQSQFLSAPLSAEWLRRSSASFVPSANREALIDTMILESFSRGITLDTIARRLSDRFPERFPHWRKALTRVGSLSMRYSE